MSRLPEWIREADVRIRDVKHRIEMQQAAMESARGDGPETAGAEYELQSLNVVLAQLKMHREMLQREMAARYHLQPKLHTAE